MNWLEMAMSEVIFENKYRCNVVPGRRLSKKQCAEGTGSRWCFEIDVKMPVGNDELSGVTSCQGPNQPHASFALPSRLLHDKARTKRATRDDKRHRHSRMPLKQPPCPGQTLGQGLSSHVTRDHQHGGALAGHTGWGCQPSNRLAGRREKFTQNLPPANSRIPPRNPPNPPARRHPAFGQLTTQSTTIMSHESVWNSRPRTYGKGSRSWYEI